MATCQLFSNKLCKKLFLLVPFMSDDILIVAIFAGALIYL